jgi:hypothetical protein
MAAFIATPTFQTTRVEQTVMAGSASGEVAIAKSPWAREPAGRGHRLRRSQGVRRQRSDAVVQTQGELLARRSDRLTAAVR